ncbi:MAG TPA: hypothetical protein VKE71_05600 [Candidatus Angelobacter sp.]|nr:hypothetical protein [Candidatus Angelobacter sp.]
MGIIKSFDIRRLKPFHRRDDRLPHPAPDREDQIAELDPSLTPEEHAYVNHYVGYADVLLKESEEEAPVEHKPKNVVEMPRKDQERKAASDDSSGQERIA